MFDNIDVKAGYKAIEIIKSEGLKSDRVKVFVGASGGPKFIVLSALDKMLFSDFFKHREDPLFMIGSSIGAFKSAALAQKNPVKSYENFENSYFDQIYTTKPTASQVTAEGFKIINDYIDDKAIDDILKHPYIRLSFLTDKCKRFGNSENSFLLGMNFLGAAFLNIFSRKFLKLYFDRALFFDSRDTPPFSNLKDFKTHNIELSKRNFKDALIASGSIPFAMVGIKNIFGSPKGTYRDGGLLDYHFDMPFVNNDSDLVLYPHYTNRIIPGWLDKTLKWRKPSKENVANVVMISPSDKFVKSLPYNKIPDRKDFNTFFLRDEERLEYWNYVKDKSQIIADEFSESIHSGKIKDIVKPL